MIQARRDLVTLEAIPYYTASAAVSVARFCVASYARVARSLVDYPVVDTSK